MSVKRKADAGKAVNMAAQTNWPSEAHVDNSAASFETEAAASAHVAPGGSEHLGGGWPRIISNCFGQVIGKSRVLQTVSSRSSSSRLRIPPFLFRVRQAQAKS